jgi:hypothetical protein
MAESNLPLSLDVERKWLHRENELLHGKEHSPEAGEAMGCWGVLGEFEGKCYITLRFYG